MPGKESQLTPLETRKQLLVAESELNRAQMLNELLDLKNEIHRCKRHLQAAGSTVSAAAKIADAFSAVSRAFSRCEDSGNKPSWTSTLLDTARTGTSLWLLLRSFWRKR